MIKVDNNRIYIETSNIDNILAEFSLLFEGLYYMLETEYPNKLEKLKNISNYDKKRR